MGEYILVIVIFIVAFALGCALSALKMRWSALERGEEDG